MSWPPNQSPSKPPTRTGKLSDVLGSSRQVWLAGLGALAAAQTEGATALDSLVKRGEEVERRLKREAQSQPAGPATARHAGRAVEPRATERLGLLFEQRVARAVERLGMRPATDVNRLSAQVEKLSSRVDALAKQVAGSVPPKERPPGKQAKETRLR